MASAEKKYNVGLNLPGNAEGNETKNNGESVEILDINLAAFIPLSVRRIVLNNNKIPDAPFKDLVEGVVLLADISGFTALGEKLMEEFGDSTGAEKFAEAISSAISDLVNVLHRYEGECVKIAGDCLICCFVSNEEEDGGDETAFRNAKLCAIDLLNTIKKSNESLDLHGGIATGTIQRLHVKELRGSSPRSNSARQRMKARDEAIMTKAELERSKQRWYLIAGRPIKIAGELLEKAPPGVIKMFGGMNISRETLPEQIGIDDLKKSQPEKLQREASRRITMVDKFVTELSNCPKKAKAYLPPIVAAKNANNVGKFTNEKRRVVIAFVSVPGLEKKAVKSQGVEAAHLNDVYSALKSVLNKFEGLMRDFLFEDKGCTMICCFGIDQISEVDALRAVLFALEATAACETLTEPCKIGISMGQCFTGVCGHVTRCDFVVMGPEVNMAARLMGKAETGKILVSERVYNATQNYVGYDMTKPIELKGREGTSRALRPFGKKAGAVRHKAQDQMSSGVFVGRESEMNALRAALNNMLENKSGSAFILEGLAGMGKSAIVWNFQAEALEKNVRFLMGTGSAIEKQTPYFAFAQILCAAANLSSSPSYGEVLALKHTYQLDEDDVNSLGIILPSLAKRDEAGNQLKQGRLEGRAAQVCLKIFNSMENSVFVFEDAHWIDSQSWIMLQMILPQLSSGSMVMIVTRPPNMASQMKGGGQHGTEGFRNSEEKVEEEFLEDDDRVKFSRILAGLKAQADITLLSLGVMDEAGMHELTSKILEVPIEKIGKPLLKLLNAKAGGIPMYISSMSAWLVERGMVNKDDDGRVQFNGDINNIQFPASIMDTVLERVDSLDEYSKALIKVCACFGFEFCQDYLDSIICKFIGSEDPQVYQKALSTLAERGLVVPVTGESVAQMMKFTHQIICESAYNLMLDSQRREVHLAIANEYENAGSKFEMEILAYHWLRSGEVDRGCIMLQAAAEKAIDIGAYKEAVNQLSLAIAHGKEHKNKPLWLSLLGYTKYLYGNWDDAVTYGVLAMKALDDKEIIPAIRSKLTVDALKRTYAEYEDLPPSKPDNIDDIDRAKMYVFFLLGYCFQSRTVNKKALMQEYGLQPSDFKRLAQYYHQKCMILAYYQGNDNIWCLQHGTAPNSGTYEVDEVRQFYRRVQNIVKSERVKPELRVDCLMFSFMWYTPHSPEYCKTGLQQMLEITDLIDGNLKHASKLSFHFMIGSGVLFSIGDYKMAKHFGDRACKVKCDTEAAEDTKATVFEYARFTETYIASITGDRQRVKEGYTKHMEMGKSFASRSPSNRWGRFTTLAMGVQYIDEGEYELAEKLIASHFPHGLIYFIYNVNTHLSFFIEWPCEVLIRLYEFHTKQGKDTKEAVVVMKQVRARMEDLAKTRPGMYRMSGVAYGARLTLILKDRPFADVLSKLKEALDYAAELAVMPQDTITLKQVVALFENSQEGLEIAKEEFEKFCPGCPHVSRTQRLIDELKSGIREPVDLSFVPEIVEENNNTVDDSDPLTAIEKKIVEAKARFTAATDKDEKKSARATMKALIKEKKALEEKIAAEKNAIDIDAKIAELETQLAEANAKAMQAMEEDDEDAEEIAYEEAERLMEELEALKAMSIPKKKLLEAQQKDKAN